jgi:acyl dehydratase
LLERLLERLRVRFTKPVYPGDTLTFLGWHGSAGELAFEVRNQDQKIVLADGRAVVATPRQS